MRCIITVMIAGANALMSDTGKIERGEEGGCAGKVGDLVPLEMFNYGNEKLGCILQESIDDLRFLGISVSYICMRSYMYMCVLTYACVPVIPGASEVNIMVVKGLSWLANSPYHIPQVSPTHTHLYMDTDKHKQPQGFENTVYLPLS